MPAMNKTQQIDAGRLKALVNLTLPQVLAVQAEYLGDRHVAIREKAYGIWQRYTWKEYLSHVRHVSLALKALGLKRNDIAAIIMDNHPEWLFSELGAQALGAVTLNLFTSAVASELIQALVRIRTPLVIAQDQEQVDKLLDQKDKLPFVKTIVYVDPTGMGSYRDNTLLMSFRELLEVFFTSHDPTTLNRQGADVGTQYRSAIFYHDEDQKQVAEEVIREMEAAAIWDDPIVTEVSPLDAFHKAEDYHQEYYRNNTYQPYCQVVIAPKVSKFRQKYLANLKPSFAG